MTLVLASSLPFFENLKQVDNYHLLMNLIREVLLPLNYRSRRQVYGLWMRLGLDLMLCFLINTSGHPGLDNCYQLLLYLIIFHLIQEVLLWKEIFYFRKANPQLQTSETIIFIEERLQLRRA
jgi:hypothetical protein